MTKTLTAEKILQSQGFGTRKQCQTWIKQGHVKINDEIITNPKASFDVNGGLSFQLFQQQFEFFEKMYIALNKPQGYECSHQAQKHLSVFDLLPHYLRQRGVQTVGRLDQDTTGLLLLTDDGQFLHKMTHPKQHIKKYYRVVCRDHVQETQMAQLQHGVQLHQEKHIFQALDIERIDDVTLRFAIEQGVFHQVKRMLHAVGNDVEALHRDQMGQLCLHDLALAEGQWKILSSAQLQLLN